MVKHSIDALIILLRGTRLALHLVFGMLVAAIYPHLPRAEQFRVTRIWNKKLLNILNIGIQINGQLQHESGREGCMVVSNHVSWLDIIVLNAIHPLCFISKLEVRGWPVIGWLSRRSGTIFIERAMRRDAAMINLHVSTLLKQGVCIGLFPEGTTTDGKQVGHFHSALIQPAIDAGIRLCPVSLRYQDENGALSAAAAFIGETTLVQSIWNILRCSSLNVSVQFATALPTTSKNRRLLARTAQAAIAQKLQSAAASQQSFGHHPAPAVPQAILSSQSAYALLIDPQIQQLHK